MSVWFPLIACEKYPAPERMSSIAMISFAHSTISGKECPHNLLIKKVVTISKPANTWIPGTSFDQMVPGWSGVAAGG